MPTRVINRIKHWLRLAPTDPRSRRFVALIECILNQNARDVGAACAPAMDSRFLQLCHEHGIGIVQMPCPEIHALGFARKRASGQSIRDALNDETGIERCSALANDIAERIEVYLAQDYELVAILGGNPESPGCAIHLGGDGLCERSGLLMRQLQHAFRLRGRDPRFLAIRDHDPELRRLILGVRAPARHHFASPQPSKRNAIEYDP